MNSDSKTVRTCCLSQYPQTSSMCPYYCSMQPRPQVLNPKSTAVGVSHGSLVVVRVRSAEEIDARPESLRYNWFWPFAATAVGHRGLVL